jgi:hypothetical protein
VASFITSSGFWVASRCGSFGQGGGAGAGSTADGGSTADAVAGGTDSPAVVDGGGATGCGALDADCATGATGATGCCGAAASPRHAAQVATLLIANHRQMDEAGIELE